MAQATIGALRAVLGMDTAAFEKGATKAEQRYNHMSKRFQAQTQSIIRSGKLMVAGLTAAAGGLAVAFAGAANGLAELENLANVAGVGVERFKILSLAAKTYGIEQDKLSDILKDTNDKFGDFIQTGAGPLVDFFDNIAPKVGLTKEEFKGLSSEQALGKYVKALEDANVSQAEMTFYMEALASDATLLYPLFRNNASEIENMSRKAKDLGLNIDASMIQKGREAQQELSIVGEVLRTQLAVALVELAPVIQDVTQRIINLLPKIMEWAGAAVDAIERVADAANVLFGDAGANMPESRSGMEKRLEGINHQLNLLHNRNWDFPGLERAIGEDAMQAAGMKRFLGQMMDVSLTPGQREKLRKNLIKELRLARDDVKAAMEADAQSDRESSPVSTLYTPPVLSGRGAGSIVLETERETEAINRNAQAIRDAALAMGERVAEARRMAEAHTMTVEGIQQEIRESEQLIAALGVSAEEYERTYVAQQILNNGFLGGEEAAKAYAGQLIEVRKRLAEMRKQVIETTPEIDKLKTKSDDFGKSMDDAFQQGIRGVNQLVNAFKNGDIEGIITGIMNVIGSQGSGTPGINGQGGGFLSSLGDIFGGFKAKGGPVMSGKAYVVGEMGPELFMPGRSGQVIANDNIGGGGIAHIIPSPYFDVVVDGRAANVAKPIAAAQSAIAVGGAQQRASRAQRKSLAPS